MSNLVSYGLTGPQKNIWNTELFFNNTNANNVCVSAIIRERIDFNLLKQAINLVVSQNDSFRIHIVLKDNEPTQVFCNYTPFDISIDSLSSKDDFSKLEQEVVNTKFDILNSDLFLFKLVKFPDSTGGIILNVHHIIADSWSLGLTIQEIIKNYHSLKSGIAYTPNTFSYKDYINSEIQYKNSKKYLSDKEFWTNYLSELPEPVTIPGSNNNLSSSLGDRISFTLDKDLCLLINNYCKNHNISNYVFFMSVFAVYIANLSNSYDFIVGTPILNRINFKEKSSMGMFVETVPFRFYLDASLPFSEFASKNAVNLLSILRHQKYSYTDILQDLRSIDSSIPNLYNIAVSYQITKAYSKDLGDYETNWTFNNHCLNDLNIHIYDINDTGFLKIDYDYLNNKYSNEDIILHHTRIINIIKQVLDASNDIALNAIKIVTEDEMSLINSFNNNFSDYPKCCIHRIISDISKKYPNNIAVTDHNQSITYLELENRSNIIANKLKYMGIVPGDIVAIYMSEKNIDLICSILGVLKVGASFLGIYPDYPIDRIKYMIQDSNSKCIIVGSEQLLSNLALDIKFINISSLDFSKQEIFDVDETDINFTAYIIYTSGSTGKPKGVSLSHKNLVNFVFGFSKYLGGVIPCDKFLSVTNICFDVSMAEIFTPLCFGASLYLYKDLNYSTPKALAEYIANNHITFSYFPPALLGHVCAELKKCENVSLNKMLVGVEPIKASILSDFLNINPSMRIINGYGPTETTICCTMYHFENNLPSDVIVPIGKPFCNNKMHVLNKFMNYLPVNTLGTLWVSGDGVGNGYIGQAKAINESYKMIDGTMFYNTGDLVKWDCDGILHFIGRSDNQVKYRGYRIDLGEIEASIKKFKGVSNCFVLLDKTSDLEKLVGFVCTSEDINEFDIRAFLSSTIPHYMIPNLFIFLKSFPLTPNGKIDKKELLKLANDTYNSSAQYVAPKTDTEKEISALFSEILNVANVGLNDNFFELGGDSLSAIRLISDIDTKLHVTILMKDIFAYPTVASLSSHIDQFSKNNEAKVIVKAKKAESYPLTFAQKRVFYTMKLDESSVAYNAPFGIIFDKLPDVFKLENCFNILINRHQALRTYFVVENDTVVQKILDNVKINLQVDNEEDTPLGKIFEDFVKPFNLSSAPLFRVKFVKYSEKYILLVDMHHIICDGQSSAIFADELCRLYNDVPLEDKKLDYIDFAVWENSNISSYKFESAKNYWLNLFNGPIPVLNMPLCYVRPKIQSFEGNKLYMKMDRKNIIDVCRKLNKTPYMFLLSIYYILLYKYTNQEDIIVGSPIVGRDNSQLSNIIGMFVNTLPLKAHIDSNVSFKDFVKAISSKCVEAFENQIYPLDELIKSLNIPRDSSSTPLFSTMFTYQNNGIPQIKLNGVNTKYYIPDNKTSKFDFSLEVVPNGDYFDLTLEYCTKLFNEQYMQDFLAHYVNLLTYISAHSFDEKISDLSMLSKNEQTLLLDKFNDTALTYSCDKTITQLFEEQVQKNPDKTAIIFNGDKLSYFELNKRANQIAYYLRNAGVCANKVVGIMINRSFELIANMLGVLKAGGAYLPIDPTYPKERINYILKDSGVDILLTSSNLKDSIQSDVQTASLVVTDFDKSDIYSLPDNNLEVINNSNDLAYLIYTSGSTGNPKGVMLTHKNVNNFISATCDKIPFEGNIVSVTTFCFDIFVLESLLPLQRGLTIVLANEQEQNIPKLLNNICVENNVTMLQTTPARMSLLLSDETSLDYLSLLKVIMLGGEPFPAKLLTQLKGMTNARIYNMYGPTETTVWSSIKDLTDTSDITIGGPLGNTKFYIFDKDKNLLPPFIPGNLYIGGDGVGNGYFHRDDLTKERFIVNPYDKNEIIYNTGDIAKWSLNGETICMGRSDFQVKVRGLRIELEEIENRILQFPNIQKAVVCVKKDSFDREFLCAYFVSNERIKVPSLKEFLNQFLPMYMIPNKYMQLSDFKYTPNGKIDKKALPDIKLNMEEKPIVLASTPTELKLSNLFEDLLAVSPISIYDNFFEIGGDSMLALKLQIALLNDNINITYSDIFKYNTIKELADKIDNEKTDNSKTFNLQYDFSDIDKLLSVNNINSLKTINKNNIGNIILTGATGFLGAHILSYILDNTNLKVYCLLRPDPSTDVNTKLLNRLNYYFKDKYINLLNDRFFAISSNIIEGDLGLDINTINLLNDNTSCVINSAAIVKHFGDYKDFEEVNVTGVKNLVAFCNTYHKKFVQISTISVSGNSLFDLAIQDHSFKDDVIFDETNLYIGQSLENVYIRSKFEAEKIVFENMISNNLDALILRIGNITNRSTDGKFQPNSDENAFANRLKAFIELKCIPNYLQNIYAEFSPVDNIAEAVFKSILYANGINVLHIYNSNHVYMKNLIDLLPNNMIEFVSDDIFNNKLSSLLSKSDSSAVSSLANDLDSQKQLTYDNKIKIKNDFTNAFLQKIGFNWSIINKDYIDKLLKNI